MYESNPFIVADAPAADRAAFFRRTYGLVALAFSGFAALLAIFFIGFDQEQGIAFLLSKALFGMIQSLGGWSVLLVMVAFWGGNYVAQSLAFNRASRSSQYAGLGIFVVLEALIFIPLIAYVIISTKGNASSVLVPAGIVTGAIIAALTTLVFMTNLDFSFLKGIIVIASFAAIAAVVVAVIFGLSLGTWFSIAMIALMATVILYQTNEVKNNLETDQHVTAAFILFSTFITMLFYVIRLFANRGED